MKNADEMKELLMRLGASSVFLTNTSMPTAAKTVGLLCWLRRTRENNDTKELRRQLLFLHITGGFDYEERK